jgi:two-component system, cell cycle sensor histidine kinase and response regulator CckA
LAYDLFRRAKEGASPEAMLGSQRDDQHGRIRALGRPGGPLWYLVLALPDRDITADPWRRAVLVAFLSVALLALFAGLAFHLAHRVARPLAELVAGAEALARGHDPVLPLPQIQEIQTLGQALATARLGMVEREALQRTLLTGQRLEALGTLAGGIAHDLNNQLFAILSQLELGLNKVPEGHPSWKNLKQAWDASRRCTDTCRALLAFGRPAKPVLAPMDLNTLVGDTLGLLVNLLGPGICVTRNLQATPAMVMVDRAQVEHLVTNLMINARDALPAGGTIQVSTAVVGEELELRVQDDGVGMTPEVLERIFDPFYTTKEPGQGTGMGLAMAMGVAKAHGGRIEAKSEPGKGSTFILRLPRGTGAASEPEPAEVHLTPRLEGLRILVADDEEAVGAAIAEALEAYGVSVSRAPDGEEAWAMLEACPHDLLLTDQLMPHCTGRELVDRLRATGSRIPVLLMSGWDLESQEGLLASDPNLILLAKPFTISRMIVAVEELLRRREQTSAAGSP